MKLVYVGNFEPSASTENHVSYALAELGHDVWELQESKATVAQIREACADADLLLYTRTEGLTPSSRREWLDLLETLPIPSASYHLDLYAGLRRGAGLRDDPFWRTRYVFSADGGSPEFFKAHGINHFWLPPGVHGPECYMAQPSPEMATDILFVGSGGHRAGYHPEWPWRDKMIRFLADTYGPRFSKHGHPPMGSVGTQHVRGHKLNVAYASAKIVVGDSLSLGPETEKGPIFSHARYWSDRVPETIGRGGFLLMPDIPGLAEHVPLARFKPGDLADLKAQIDYWLAPANEAFREGLRVQLHSAVKANHTYANRMAEMLRVISREEAAR